MSKLCLLDSQYLFLLSHQIIGGTPLCYSFVINGDLDIERLKVSLQCVIDTNPALQVKFKGASDAQTFESYSCISENLCKASIHYEKVTHLTSEQHEELFATEFEQLLNRKWKLDTWPLFCVYLYKLSSDKHFFLMGIDHLVSDGLSNLKLLHELFFNYSTDQNLPPCSFSHYNSIAEKINKHEFDSEELAQFSDYSSKIGKKGYFWNPHHQQLISLIPGFQTDAYTLNQAQTELLLKATKCLRVSLYSLIVSAYIDVLLSFSLKEERILFQLPTSGKVYPEVDANYLIGCFAQGIALDFKKDILNLPIAERIQLTHDKIHHALQWGVDRIQTRKMAESIKRDFKLFKGSLSPFSQMLARSSMKSNLYISYTGYSPLQSQYGPLKLSSYKEGSINHAGSLDFMHVVFDQQLHLFCNYDAHFFEKKLIADLMSKILQWLSKLPIKLSCLKNITCNYTEKKIEEEVISELIQTLYEVSSIKIPREKLSVDLEAEGGVDSLARIRFIAKLSSRYKKKLSKQELFECRSLAEFGELISYHLTQV